MGAANSNLTRCLEDEYQRLRKQGRDHLVVDEVLVLRLPASSWSLDTSHLGVLFMLDRQAACTMLLSQSDLTPSTAQPKAITTHAQHFTRRHAHPARPYMHCRMHGLPQLLSTEARVLSERVCG